MARIRRKVFDHSGAAKAAISSRYRRPINTPDPIGPSEDDVG